MALPRLQRVVVNAGVGSAKDRKKRELVLDRITRIAGQKATFRPARKSIASFKLRQGEPIGVAVTLRGERMRAFLDKLIHIAIPRMRDFKGINVKSIDEMGNLSIGIPEHTIFPETSDEDLKDVFGLTVTIVTSAKDRTSAEALLRHIGIPLKS